MKNYEEYDGPEAADVIRDLEEHSIISMDIFHIIGLKGTLIILEATQ